MFVQVTYSELLKILLPTLVWWCIIMSQIVFLKDRFSVFKVKVTVNNIIKIWLFDILSEMLILLQLDLVWWHIIIRWIFLWKDWIALFWSRFCDLTTKVQNSSESSSDRCFLNCWTFCNQTCYGGATSWAKVSRKKIGLVSSSSGSQWGLIWSIMTVCTITAELQIFLQI